MKEVGNITKKIGSLFLTIAMIVTSFPILSHEVYAAELPSNTQFATVDELKTFNTNDNDGEKNPAKVYFGNNNQQWWIVGSQNDNSLVLFAASPLAKSQQFEPNWNSDKTYDESWNCNYTDGSTPSYVYPNHYGASPLRTTLKGLEASYFTSVEQGLMNDTTVHTNDTKNNSVYSTTDKLYLAYGDNYDNQYITVGTNSRDSLNDGLRIDMDYWGNDGHFWLRAPNMYVSTNALVAEPGNYVFDHRVNNDYVLVPAFELNLSSVLFASAAPAAFSDGQLQTSEAFTLRHRPQTSMGIATISQSKESITITGVTNENTYLVVQTRDGAWSKKVSDNDLVFASEMNDTLSSFENCKVWLETTEDRITYASEATQGSGYNVKVNVGDNLTVTGGNILQTNVSGNITEITIKVNDGYYLPDNLLFKV